MSEEFKKDVQKKAEDVRSDVKKGYEQGVKDLRRQEKAVNKNLWRFGTREVVYAAIGAALYAVISMLSNWAHLPGGANVTMRPAVVIPMFFGIAFGPVVGFITGFLGNIITDFISGYGFWLWWDLGNGLLGFVPGLFAAAITDYRATKSILLAELSVILGSAAGMGLAAASEIWVSGKDFLTALTIDFVPAFLSNIVNGLILLPLLMVAYQAIVARNSR
ncbi:MAG: ECF transporter S component [Anaerolineaceae bacterium]|nr:ECF transporter S component [Anaerolineaceae bacterium]